jgi:competence protein CoiA
MINDKKEVVAMLKAIRKDGTPFQLLPRHSKEELRREKSWSEFFCPECKEKVTMKIGSQRIEHFAHQAGSSCLESYERESQYHLNGKLQLYEWLETQRLQPLLEPYYESIKQRPDISVHFAQREYVIEYQCSPIPPELMVKRTTSFLKGKMACIWIMGGKNIKRKGEKKVCLSNFHYLFLHKTPSGIWFIPSYCSTTKMFIFLTNIVPTTTKNALTHFFSLPVQSCTFKQLLNPQKSTQFNAEDWRKEIDAQKVSIQMNSRYQYEFINELYGNGVNISLLPPFVGLPVSDAPIIETPPFIWQSYLFIDLFNRKVANETFSFSEVYRLFTNRVQKGQIKTRILPFVPDCSMTLPLAQYLQLLVQFQVLEKINQNTFRLKEDIMSPEHFVQKQTREEQFYKDYHHLFFQAK